ncbi:unnamed protein product [Calypogeia fissa]
MSGEETSLAVVEGAPPVVKETVLKKRKRNEEWATVRKERHDIAKAKARANSEGTFRRAEEYVKQYRLQEKDLMRLHREGKKLKTIRPKKLDANDRLLFVIRIRGTTDMHPKTRKILQVLKLRQIFFGVFMKANKNTMTMLRKVDPYVTYGYPNLQTVSDLIYKRGHARVKKERISLTDNNIIENALGKHDIICIPDLINEIYNIGPHFKEAIEFLWPFKLSPPANGGSKPGNHFVEVSDAGNRKEKINGLIYQMN